MPKNRVYRNISSLITNAGVAQKKGIRPLESDLGIIKDGAFVWSDREGILWVGPTKSLPAKFKKWPSNSGKGLVAYPGLVDSHTHIAFAGDRAHEFELRMAGATYKEIAAAGGGILTTVKATRSAPIRD